MVIGIITARAGSKGIPGKNMVPLGGSPLIEHTFRLAQGSAGIDRTFLTTDIPEAIALARDKYSKIEVPFVRPPELCADDTSQSAVVEHLLCHLQNTLGLEPKAIVLLQPTSPFRRVAEVDEAIQIFKNASVESMIGVASALHHPADYLYQERPGATPFRWVFRSATWQRRQDFPEVYFNTGALYMCRLDYFRRHQRFYDERSRLFIMANETSLDIDTPFDLALARGWLAQNERALDT
jgi:CMP-N-acetylneuraminic acid synthetase